jgi:hypothetical protein
MNDYQRETLNKVGIMLEEIKQNIEYGQRTSVRKIVELVAMIILLSENGGNKKENECAARRAYEALEDIEKDAEQYFKAAQQNVRKALSDIRTKTEFEYAPNRKIINNLQHFATTMFDAVEDESINEKGEQK